MVVLPDFRMGGAELSAVRLVNYLAGREHSVSVVAFADEDGPLRERVDASVQVLSLNRTRGREAVPSLFGLLREGRPDVVVTFHVQTAVALTIARIGTETTHVVCEHSLPLSEAVSRFRGLSLHVQLFLLKMAYTRAAHVTCPSLECVQEIRKVTRNRIDAQVLPNPVLNAGEKSPEADLHPWLAEERTWFSVLMVGRDDPQKGLLWAEEVVANIRQLDIDARLIVVGPTSTEPLVHADADVDEWITRIGTVGNPLTWIAAADLLLVTSERESFGNTLIESMSVGTPVAVIGTQGAPARLVGEFGGGIFFPDRSPGVVARGVAECLVRGVPDCRAGDLERYTLENAGLRFEQMLAEVVRGVVISPTCRIKQTISWRTKSSA